MTVVEGTWLLAMTGPPVQHGRVAVEAGRIVAMGAELADRHPDQIIDGVILPGLVNAHTHLELSYLQGAVPPAAAFADWVSRLMALRQSRNEDTDPAVAEAAREAADASYRPPQTEQRVLDTGLAWCYFMAVSSNLRYNAVNGVEDWAYGRARRGAVAAAAAATGGGAAAPLLLASPAAARSVSVALRLSNNVFGAHSFIQLAKFLNLDRPREVGGRKKKEKEKQGSKEASKDGVWWRPRSAVVA